MTEPGLTERLEIEVLRPEHAESLFDDLQAPELYAYVPERAPASVEALRSRYARLVAGPGDPGELWLNRWMFRRGDRRPVGWLQATVYPRERRAEVAWLLVVRAWGQGYATEGVGWWLGHLRDEHEVDRAMAEIDTRNARSIALAARLGFELRTTVPTDEGQDHVYERALR